MDDDTPTNDFPDLPIGQAVQAWRRRKGLKQQDLARRAGMSAAQLCHIEKSRNVPSVKTLRRIAEALGVSLAELASAPLPLRASEQLWEDAIEVRAPLPPLLQPLAEPAPHYSDPPGPREPRTHFLFVRDPGLYPDDERVLRAMATKVRDYLEVEEAAGAPATPSLSFRYPSAVAEGQGETLARLVRTGCGLGPQAPVDSIAFFEGKGLRVIVTDLPAGLSSCSLFDDKASNGVVFLQKKMVEERRQFRMACEFAHLVRFVTNGFAPVADTAEARRFAREFASAFLMPEEALLEVVDRLGLPSGEWTPALLVRVKGRFGVTAEVFAYRLEAVGLLSASDRASLVSWTRDYARGHAVPEPSPTSRHLQRHSRFSDLGLVAKERARG